MRDAPINKQPIELYRLLKFEALVGSGGEAKAAIAAGLVEVNGEVELRKRRKIAVGDIVCFADQTLRVTLAES